MRFVYFTLTLFLVYTNALHLVRRQTTTPPVDTFIPIPLFPHRFAFILWELGHGYIPSPEGLEALNRLANQAVQSRNFVVTASNVTAPSGDKKDFLTYAPFYWPNPNCTSTTSCPYVLKNEVNPDVGSATQNAELHAMAGKVRILAVKILVDKASNVSNTTYYKALASQVRAFFLDSSTKMNPNVNYGQVVRDAIPSASVKGRFQGIFQTRWLAFIPGAVQILRNATADAGWSASDESAVKAWYKEYMNWLTSSELGVQARNSVSLHSTYWYAQAVTIHRYLGDHSTVRSLLKEFFTEKLPQQITDRDEAIQQMEEYNIIPAHYALINLVGIVYLARFGLILAPDDNKSYYPDAWTHRNRAVYRFHRWWMNRHPWQQIDMSDYDEYRGCLRSLKQRYGNGDSGEFQQMEAKVGPPNSDADKVQAMLGRDDASVKGEGSMMLRAREWHAVATVTLLTAWLAL